MASFASLIIGRVHIINIRSINLKTISPLACRKQHQSSTRESARGVISRHKNTTHADAERFVFSTALSSGGVKEMRAEKSISSVEAGSDSCTKCIQTAVANIVPVGSARNKTVLQQLAAACVRRAHIFSFGATRAEREAVCVRSVNWEALSNTFYGRTLFR